MMITQVQGLIIFIIHEYLEHIIYSNPQLSLNWPKCAGVSSKPRKGRRINQQINDHIFIIGSQYLQRMERSNSMGRPVSGSKPRKHITKISYDNPSLVSNSVTALFKYPVVQPNAEIPKPSLVSKYADSLSKAEHEFLQKKDQPLRKEQKVQVRQPPQYAPGMGLERRNSSPLMMPSASFSENRYNILNHEAIKSKQSHGYNIINCFPTVK